MFTTNKDYKMGKEINYFGEPCMCFMSEYSNNSCVCPKQEITDIEDEIQVKV